MINILIVNPENVTEEEANGYSIRSASRAVLFDDGGLVAVLHAAAHNYHKLPGGGIEEGEDPIAALKRECLEETGCNIEITAEIGETVEYRKRINTKQISHCYMARILGEKGEVAFTEEEIDDGFELLWVPFDEAKKLVSENKTDDYFGKFMVARDSAILDEAKKMM